MRLTPMILLLAFAPGARAETDAASEAHSELEARRDAAAEAEPVAEPTPAPPAAAPAPAPAPTAAAAPAVSERNAKLNLGGQVVFALAGQAKAMKEASTGDLAGTVKSLERAGAFSVDGGSWLSADAVSRNGAAVRSALVDVGEKLEPVAEVDPTDAAAVKGKSKELVEALASIELLLGAAADAGRREALSKGLADFKLALDPPYAYGQSHKKIYGYTAASLGAMVTMAGVGALTNPLEREQNNFGWYATGVGLTSAGVGVALILLDDR